MNSQLSLLVRFVQSDRFVNFALRNEKTNIPDDLVDPRRPILRHLCTEIYIIGTLKVLYCGPLHLATDTVASSSSSSLLFAVRNAS